jgi:hypothetical protein
MVLSVGFVVTLFSWCIVKVVTSKGNVDRLHGLDDIDTGDKES